MPGERSAPVGELAAPGPRRCSQLALPDARSPRTGSAAPAAATAGPAKARVERRQLADQDAHRPAVARRCGAWSKQERVLLRAEAQQSGPQQRARAPGRTAGRPRPAASARASASRAGRPAGPPGRPRAAGPARRRLRRPAPARRPPSAKTVRSTSWRRTISVRPPPGPARRAAAAAARPPGCCRPGCPGRAGRGTRGAPGRRRAGSGSPARREPARSAAGAAPRRLRRHSPGARPAPRSASPRKSSGSASRQRSATCRVDPGVLVELDVPQHARFGVEAVGHPRRVSL